MALTSITTRGVVANYFNRGNIGTVQSINARTKSSVLLPSTGGSCTYPSQDDVRSGVTFGVIYTGNLVLPAEADVELGVGYGSNGTEFTGSLVGGVGGGDIFIINE